MSKTVCSKPHLTVTVQSRMTLGVWRQTKFFEYLNCRSLAGNEISLFSPRAFEGLLKLKTL